MHYVIAGAAGAMVPIIGILLWLGSGKSYPPDYGDRG
jgi:hypothetical protein